MPDNPDYVVPTRDGIPHANWEYDPDVSDEEIAAGRHVNLICPECDDWWVRWSQDGLDLGDLWPEAYVRHYRAAHNDGQVSENLRDES